ncbi:MAG: sigma-70 family RNA polymerase sigma factor [Bacteroidota bacterium]
MGPQSPQSNRIGELRSDAQLVECIRLGDARAFAELFNRHKRSVYEYCFRLLQDRDNAADAMQNTFIKMFNSIAGLKSTAAFKVWMFTIARNEVFEHIRRSRSNGLPDEDDLWGEESPYEEYIQQEQTELVQRAIAQLKPDYREVLVLLEYEQLSYSEIASITGATIGSVESRIFKARKALAKKLKPYM